MKSANDALLHVAGAIRGQLDRDITTRKPHYPPAHSVRGRVLGRLLRGSILTSGDVWRELSASRLAATIYQLRHEFGWDIHSHRIRVRTRDNGRDALISEYWLDSRQRREIGEEGKKFVRLTTLAEKHRNANATSPFLELPSQMRRETAIGISMVSEFRRLVEFAEEVESARDIFPIDWCHMGALAMMKLAAARIEPVNRLTDESLNQGV